MRYRFFLICFVTILPFFSESQNLIENEIPNKQGIILEKLVEDNENIVLFSVGSKRKEFDYNFKEIFKNKNFEQIKKFLIDLPINNDNLIVQKLVYKILTSEFLIEDDKLTREQDLELFTIKINKLFQTARFSDIDEIYSKTSLNFVNENLNLKRIEGYFLRNEYKNACSLLNEKSFVKSYKFGKFEIICNIIEQKFEKARFNLSLLKERNEPGDSLFIDLCYSIIGDLKISKSKVLSDNKNEIASLNPILLSSLQLAEISPKFEHVKDTSPSILTFILLSPSSDVDIKLYTAELLVKQERIDKPMLADIYQLSSFTTEELENAIKDYKKLSPLQSRSLLYQSLIRENNNEIKFELAKTLLRQADKDGLFTHIAYLIKDSIDYKKIQNLSEKEVQLIFKIYLSVKKFDEAEIFINSLNESQNQKKYLLLLNLFKFLDNGIFFDKEIFNDYFDSKKKEDELIDKKNLYITIVSQVLFKEEIDFSTVLLDSSEDIDEIKVNSLNMIALIDVIENRNHFNSFRVIFKTLKDKNFNELNIFEKILIIKVLLKLDMNDEFKIFAKNILLSIL